MECEEREWYSWNESRVAEGSVPKLSWSRRKVWLCFWFLLPCLEKELISRAWKLPWWSCETVSVLFRIPPCFFFKAGAGASQSGWAVPVLDVLGMLWHRVKAVPLVVAVKRRWLPLHPSENPSLPCPLSLFALEVQFCSWLTVFLGQAVFVTDYRTFGYNWQIPFSACFL